MGSYQCGTLRADLELCPPSSLAPGMSGCVLAPLIAEACRVKCSLEVEALRDRRLAKLGVACCKRVVPVLCLEEL